MTVRLPRLVQLLMLGLVLFFATVQPAAAQSLLRDSETELLFKDVSDPLIVAAGLDPKSVKVVLINDPEINAWLAITAALVAIAIPRYRNHSGIKP